MLVSHKIEERIVFICRKHKHREKDHHNRSHKETEEERRIRKERERRERKGEANDHKIRNKADLDIKNEPEDSQENYTAQSENGEENYKMECDVKEEPHDSEEDTVLVSYCYLLHYVMAKLFKLYYVCNI